MEESKSCSTARCDPNCNYIVLQVLQAVLNSIVTVFGNLSDASPSEALIGFEV